MLTKPPKLKDHRRIWLSAVLLLAMLVLVTVMVLDLIPLVRQVIDNRSDEAKVVKYIEAYGAKGVPVLIGLQVLQVLVSIFPAVPIQMLAGLCYGVWLGALICVVGCVLGNALLFALMRQFGKVLEPVLGRKPKPGKAKNPKHSALNLEGLAQSKHPERAVFLLYLIPGIPDGVLPLLFVKSGISLPTFALAVTAASLPSALLSTWLGERVAKGDYRTAIILAIVLVIVVVVLFLCKNRLVGLLGGNSSSSADADKTRY